jgi:hypothetical protein
MGAAMPPLRLLPGPMRLIWENECLVGGGATAILARYGTGYIPRWRAIALFSASDHPIRPGCPVTRVPGVPAFHASAARTRAPAAALPGSGPDAGLRAAGPQ